MTELIRLGDIEIAVTRKRVKNVHVSVQLFKGAARATSSALFP